MGTTPILLYGDTLRAPALRHEVPLAIVDPFLLVEVDGRRVAVVGELELPRVAGLDGLETLTTQALGISELRARMPQQQAAFEVVRRACVELGVSNAVVPGDFPLALARALESAGIGLEPRDEVFTERRRRKSPAELEGIRAAQHAADAAMTRVRDLLAESDATGDVVTLDDEPLTSERLRSAILEVVRAHDAELDELDRLARWADGGGPRAGLRRDPARRADHRRHLAARPRLRLPHRHDPHVRVRRAGHTAHRAA